MNGRMQYQNGVEIICDNIYHFSAYQNLIQLNPNNKTFEDLMKEWNEDNSDNSKITVEKVENLHLVQKEILNKVTEFLKEKRINNITTKNQFFNIFEKEAKGKIPLWFNHACIMGRTKGRENNKHQRVWFWEAD